MIPLGFRSPSLLLPSQTDVDTADGATIGDIHDARGTEPLISTLVQKPSKTTDTFQANNKHLEGAR